MTDEEGLERSTLEAVQEQAARPPADMARDAVRKHHKNENGMGATWQLRCETTTGLSCNLRPEGKSPFAKLLALPKRTQSEPAVARLG
jgi:hypothetical protein